MNKRKTMKKNRKQRGGSAFMNRLGRAVSESLSPTESFADTELGGEVAAVVEEAAPAVVEAAKAPEEAATNQSDMYQTEGNKVPLPERVTEDEIKNDKGAHTSKFSSNSKTFAELDKDGNGIIDGPEFNNMQTVGDGSGIIDEPEFNNMQTVGDGSDTIDLSPVIKGGAMNPGKRSFKCSMINKRSCCTGRYISKTPMAAARKYLGIFCKTKGKSKHCKALFDLRETTRGSNKKIYSFKGERVNLTGKEKKKVMRGDKVIEYRYNYTVHSV